MGKFMDGVSCRWKSYHLKVKPILLIHRNKPKEYGDYKFPIEAYWHGDDLEFEKIFEKCEE